MDYHRQTTPRPATTAEDIAASVRSLLDRNAISDLIALYSIARDDNDVERLLQCFAPDGRFEIGGREHRGHEALRAFYVGNMTRYRTSLHTTHTAVIDIIDGTSAAGIVTGHAELSYDGDLMMAAYRYTDRYQRIDGRWVFERRELRFMYTMPLQEMATGFRTSQRIRWPGQPAATAELPETTPTWQTFRTTGRAG